jgi:prepilin-type N-terminal cleavage/methylation domain-containing protein
MKSNMPEKQSRVLNVGHVHGYSLIELMVVMAVMVIIMAAVFKSINVTQQKSTSEAVKLDLTQQAREFMDQITRDLRSAGYPNSRNMTKGSTDPFYNGNCPDLSTNSLTSPCDPTNGTGLIRVTFNSLWFAGDVDGTANGNGTAQVKIVKYDLVPNGTGCPCLRRTEYLRNTYQDPVTDAQNSNAVAQLEIQGVQNGTSFNDPIFTAYDPTSGAAINQAIDFTNNASTIANVNSMRIIMSVQSQHKDSTGAYPITRVVSTIGLSNCSEALGGLTLSC